MVATAAVSTAVSTAVSASAAAIIAPMVMMAAAAVVTGLTRGDDLFAVIVVASATS